MLGNFLLHKRLRHALATTQDLLFHLLNQCSNASHIYQTHGFMVVRGLDQDNLFLSKFIETCSALGCFYHANSAFSHKTHPNIYLYNTMIKILSSNHDSCAKEAIFLYKKAQFNCLTLDSYSLPFVLKAIDRLASVELGREVHCQAICTGLVGNVHVEVALIQMYSSCGFVFDAWKVFDEIRVRDLSSWNAMVLGCVKVGDVDSARVLFEQMPERNVISWTALITGYAQVNMPNEAIVVFKRMLVEGVQPDEVAMLAALSACAHLGALELGDWIRNYIDEYRLNKTIPLSNAVIDMYAKAGNINKAIKVFEGMEHRSVVTWTTTIAGLALHGLGREAIEVFSRMERAQIRPNDVTMIAVLSACSHGGLIKMGRWYFNRMVSRYGIEPRIEHYGCMIDLLGRAGCLCEAQELVRTMPFEANRAIWGSLLAASKIYGEVELGERALQHLIKLEPYNSGNYSTLSNIYAAAGRWNEAGTIRKFMRDSGVKKTSGGSCIELNKKVHEFIAGDRSHPQSERIFKVLSQLNGLLKIAGYLYLYGKCWDLLEIQE